jgi:hypothetical protein
MLNKNIVFANFEDEKVCPPGYKVINVTHSSPDIFKSLSPSFPAKVYCYSGLYANSLSNAWSAARVLKGEDDNGKPNDQWYIRRDRTFTRIKPYYFKSKQEGPLYYWWSEGKYGEAEFRRRVMLPMYREVVSNLPAFRLLEKMYIGGEKLCIKAPYTFNSDKHIDQIIGDANGRFSHAFLLYKLLNPQE